MSSTNSPAAFTTDALPVALRAAIAKDLRAGCRTDKRQSLGPEGAYELMDKLLEKYPAETLIAVLRQDPIHKKPAVNARRSTAGAR